MSSKQQVGQVGSAEKAFGAGENDWTVTIGELSGLTGLSVSAIRFYQRRGLLPAREDERGWQRFGRETLNRLAVIELAKSAGFNLDEVIRILDALNVDPDRVSTEPAIWQGLAEVKIVEIDARLNRLQEMRRLLTDALALSYLPEDRVRLVPAVLGWTAGAAEGSLDHSDALDGGVAG